MNSRSFDQDRNVSLIRSKLLILQAQAILHKEVRGEAFSRRRYTVGTYVTTNRGLHAVRYTIVRDDGLPIGGGDSYADALEDARGFLGAWDDGQQDEILRYVREQSIVFVAEEAARRGAEFAAVVNDRITREVPEKKIPKRRREVFDRSSGKCHYCSTPLTLDGKWHIEHKMPRALLGGSEISNLVAACVPCNMKKKDRTDLEFIEARKSEAA